MAPALHRRVLVFVTVWALTRADAESEFSMDQLKAEIDSFEQEVDGLCLLQKTATSKLAVKGAATSAVQKMAPVVKPSHAQQAAASTANNVGVMWASDAYIMISAALIFAMSIPGLPLLYGGLVQSKHVVSTMVQCMAVGPVVLIVWTVIGYSLSFSGNDPFIGNLEFFMMRPLMTDRLRIYQTPQGPLPESIYFTFESAFAIITAMLIVGAWAERAKFFPAVAFCGLWSLFVYCPLCHWIWGGGWLMQMGVRDYAGGLVVHLSSGAAALTAALMLPSRPGFPDNCGAPHNMPMIITGMGIIWLGWFGFNGASALQAGGQAGMTVMVTQTSACVALIVWVCLEGYRAKPTVESAVSGALAGLGSITPASGFVGVPGGIVIGFTAALATYGMWYLCKERGYADDALDVWPIHGVGGLVGTILLAFLSTEALGGVGYAAEVPMMTLFGVQCLGCLVTFVWSSFVSFFLIKGLDVTVGFCHARDVQLTGLDMEDHGAEGYDMPLSPKSARKAAALFGGLS